MCSGIGVGDDRAQAHAAIAENTIIGIFGNPVLSGNLINLPVIGQNTFVDNSATAVTTGSGTSTLTWGTTSGQPQSLGNYSYLTFNSAGNLPLSASTPTQIGTITYYNGTSSLDTLIFGATWSFYFNTVSPATLLGDVFVSINSTANHYSGTGLTPSQLQTDADYINICGSSSNICRSSIESYESTEVQNYVPLVADVMATYQGDPSITLTGVSVDPSTTNSGVIGSEPPMSVPEPASLYLFGVALAGLALTMRRGRNKSAKHW